MTLLDWRTRRRDRWAEHEHIEDIRWAFRQACAGAGVCQAVDAPIAGTAVRTPEMTRVDLGPPLRFVVRMLPGQVPAQLARAAHLIAPHLGGVALRVTDRGHGLASVELLAADPLASVFPLALPRAGRGVLLGRDEGGTEITEDWYAGAHTIAQGVTRSGKSVWTYGLLAQLAGRPDVLITGCDPTGLLWRPFVGSRHAPVQVSGLDDLRAHERLLEALVAEMDQRIGALPADRDTAELGPDLPLMIVVLEELAGMLRALDAAKTTKDDPGKRVRALLGRLLAEGAKVGIRVLLLVQRAEAAVVGAFERAMCSLRISFRTDNRASVELLHPGADPALADGHASAPPGVALLSRPGHELTRIRAPYIGSYREYVRAVAAACRPAATA